MPYRERGGNNSREPFEIGDKALLALPSSSLWRNAFIFNYTERVARDGLITHHLHAPADPSAHSRSRIQNVNASRRSRETVRIITGDH